MSDEHISFEQIAFSSVDEKGFKDVSILTKGEAGGHGLMVDEKTIEQFMKAAMGKTIPAYLTHADAIDASGRAKDRLGKEIGMFSGFYRDGDKVRAKNFQFLESFAKSEAKTHSTLVEMAGKFAENLGISPVLRHIRAWVMKDGSEAIATDKTRPATAAFEFPSMRISSVLSCDFVKQPAANLGLFHSTIDESTTKNDLSMQENSISLTKHNEEITVLSTQHKDAVTALETKHKETVAALEAKVNEGIAQLAKATEEVKGLTASLAVKTKEAEDAAKYDMRKAGAPALEIALEAYSTKLPDPAGSDWERWQQFSALEAKDPSAAKKFKEKYLSRK